MSATGPGGPATDRDVVIVGGGPSGCAAGVFTAREGLDTVVFDRGPAALPRCAVLENYLGFPVGVDVADFRALCHEHLRTAGASLVEDRVTEVTRRPDGNGFRVATQDGRSVTTATVVAAAWYDGSYLRALGEDDMFTEQEHHGEVEERFDPAYPDTDGRTPVEGLYVAAPNGSRNAQALVAAGQGAHVARTLLEDRRRDRGLSGDVAPRYDWVRSPAEFSGPWADRDRWREWFENQVDRSALGEEHLLALREAYVETAFESKVTDDAARERAERGLERLVDVLGQDAVLAAVDDAAVLDRAAALTDGNASATDPS
jgi:hypothetical protein